jgi:hypothetical protein
MFNRGNVEFGQAKRNTKKGPFFGLCEEVGPTLQWDTPVIPAYAPL